MRVCLLICGAVVAATMPVTALADDPHDPAMRNAAARARDSEMTRELNRRENERVVKTGVRWWSIQPDGSRVPGEGDYATAMRDYELKMAQYDRDRARYNREMADWRRAVAACQAGDYAACDSGR